MNISRRDGDAGPAVAPRTLHDVHSGCQQVPVPGAVPVADREAVGCRKLEPTRQVTRKRDVLSNLSIVYPIYRSLQSSQIKTNYRSEFAQCLEPWIGPAAVSQHQSELAAGIGDFFLLS